jgi:hypothetical protein
MADPTLDDLAEQYQDIVRKLDTVITGQQELGSSQLRLQMSQQALTESMVSLKQTVNELTGTVRGTNGYPGLVAEVAIIKQSIGQYRHELEGDSSKDKKEFLSKEWLLDKLVYIAVALLLYFLLDVMPELFATLGSVPH